VSRKPPIKIQERRGPVIVGGSGGIPEPSTTNTKKEWYYK